jgi:hypothetical protein
MFDALAVVENDRAIGNPMVSANHPGTPKNNVLL